MKIVANIRKPRETEPGEARFCPTCDCVRYDAKFCRTCGGKLVRRLPEPPKCSKCGNELSQYDNYCDQCGVKVEEGEIDEPRRDIGTGQNRQPKVV